MVGTNARHRDEPRTNAFCIGREATIVTEEDRNQGTSRMAVFASSASGTSQLTIWWLEQTIVTLYTRSDLTLTSIARIIVGYTILADEGCAPTIDWQISSR